MALDRTPYIAAWNRALGRDGKLCDNLRIELAELPPVRVGDVLQRALDIRAYRLANTPACDHEGATRDCEYCAWMDPAWCILVAACDPGDPPPRDRG